MLIDEEPSAVRPEIIHSSHWIEFEQPDILRREMSRTTSSHLNRFQFSIKKICLLSKICGYIPAQVGRQAYGRAQFPQL
jgi:hypothetical protein